MLQGLVRPWLHPNDKSAYVPGIILTRGILRIYDKLSPLLQPFFTNLLHKYGKAGAVVGLIN